jgi:pilus assembly protein FimV
MRAGQALRAMLLIGAAAYGVPIAAWAQAQPSQNYEIRKGDTLFAVVRKSMRDTVTRNQMLLAIYRANPGAFVDGNINRLEVGAVLAIPPLDEVARIPSADADRQVRELMAANPPASPALAAVKPAPAERPAPIPAAAVRRTAEAAAKRYGDGLSLESRGDHQGAFAAFLEAGEAGNGLAQRKLGQIYDKGNPAVPRDYQASLKWYQKAREQGVDLDKPLPRMGPP